MSVPLADLLGEPKPSDWGFNVTTCIAAITADRLIVTASDTRMSFGGEFSAEGIVKIRYIHREWAALVAGSDVSQAPFVAERASQLLRKRRGDLETVRRGIARAYQEQLRARITDEFLSPFNLTVDDFVKKGRKLLDPILLQDLSFAVKNARLGCRFLVYGFDDDERPHLFVVGEKGKTESMDSPGFWAIGNGAHSALSMLSYLGQNSEMTPMNVSIYNVLASKFISEGASDVGEKTFLFIKKCGRNGFFGPFNLEEKIRKIWERTGRPSVPQEALAIIATANIRFPPAEMNS